jgi:AAA+ ATPase superfamily predicted ATPase
MFVGRKEDLAFLNSQYQLEKFSFIPIYGRRRVGKTTLIREYIKDKKAIYFQATEEKAELNLERLSQRVAEILYPEMPKNMQLFQSFAQIFEAISKIAETEKIILIIDEYPYLANAEKTLNSLLQEQIDHHWKDLANLQLILCGSSMSFMERQVLGSKSPLYGRKTGQIKLRAFDFYQTKAYFPKMAPVQLAEIYAITGGVPQYLAQIDPNLSTIDNIKCTFLNRNAFLFEEPQNLLKQELDDPSIYNSILSAIAEGRTRLSEISSKTGIMTSNLTRYMENLIDLDIVVKKRPTGVAYSKKTIYQLKDTMFKFWFRFVAPNMSQIELEVTDALVSFINQQLSHFMGAIFEDIAITYLWQSLKIGKLPVAYREFGSWWGNNPEEKRQEEIDILGIGFQDGDLLLAECKWRNETLQIAVAEKLLKRGQLFNANHKTFYIFSKSDFSEKMLQFASENQIRLVTYDEIYNLEI